MDWGDCVGRDCRCDFEGGGKQEILRLLYVALFEWEDNAKRATPEFLATVFSVKLDAV